MAKEKDTVAAAETPAVATKKGPTDGPYAVLAREGGSYTLGTLRLEPLTPTSLAGVTLPNGEAAADEIAALSDDYRTALEKGEATYHLPVYLAANKAEADALAAKWRGIFEAKRNPKAE